MEFIENSKASLLIENFPTDIREEKIVNLCRQAGNVIRFRMLEDDGQKFSGKVVCEFSNQLTAFNAKKYLNDKRVGRSYLRADMLDEVSSGLPIISRENGSCGETSEAQLSQAVASLPPDQMFELMKQMKLCIQSNPTEARNMLLQNHQLAYALLQAQIVMKIVDPKVAIAMLSRSNDQIPDYVEKGQSNNTNVVHIDSATVDLSNYIPQATTSTAVQFNEAYREPSSIITTSSSSVTSNKQRKPMFSTFPIDLPLPNQPLSDVSQSAFVATKRMRVPSSSSSSVVENENVSNIKSDGSDNQHSTSEIVQKKIKIEERTFDEEKQKADLITQVLCLSDEQIALLPEDQRTSIMILKEQFRSTNQL